jgi:hypothetical protein
LWATEGADTTAPDVPGGSRDRSPRRIARRAVQRLSLARAKRS